MKRSAASTNEKRLERVTLVLDENLSGKTILDRLRQRSIPAIPQTDIARRGIGDEELLNAIARHPDAYLVSKDSDFRYKPSVKKVLHESGVGAFVITAVGNKTGVEIAEILVDAWPKIRRYLKKTRPPFVARILGDGTVQSHED